jgi:hypothetical protein
LEKVARRSELSVAPTVKTVGSEAGEELLASWASLPAATAMKTPAETALAAAELTAVEREPPRDMLATAPLGQLRVLTSLATKLIPAITPELEPFTWSARYINARIVFTYRTTGIKDLDSVKLGLLGHTIGLGTNGTGAVGAVTVAVGVLAVASVVGKESSTTLKLGMSGVDTGVNDVGAGPGTSGAVIGVGSATTGLVRDSSKTPSGRRLCDIGLLLEVHVRELAKVSLDNGILLDVINLEFISDLKLLCSTCTTYTRQVAEQLNNVVSHISRKSTESAELVDVGRVLPEKLESAVDKGLKVFVLHLDDVPSGNGRTSTGNYDGSRKGKNRGEECEKK